MATIDDYITAYKDCHNAFIASERSGYTLLERYPNVGFYVYLLIDPRNAEIFYVGKGIGGRVLKHEERTRRGVLMNKEKVKRLQEIMATEKEVVRRILATSEDEEVALAIESNVINALAFCGGLTNIIGGNSIKNQSVRAMAEYFSNSVAKLRKNFIGG